MKIKTIMIKIKCTIGIAVGDDGEGSSHKV